MTFEIPITQKGVVVLIDRLATKEGWGHDTNVAVTEWSNFSNIVSGCFTEALEKKGYQVRWIAVSDAMIITIVGNSPDVIIDVGAKLSWLIEYAMLQCNYFLRGSMSYGDIVQQGNFVIGNAIINAAEIYEQDQWVGISVAENTHKILNDIEQNNSSLLNDNGQHIFQKFDLPRKNKKCNLEIKKNQWVVSWPIDNSMLSTCIKYVHSLEEIDEYIANIMNTLQGSAREKWNVTRRFLGLDEI